MKTKLTETKFKSARRSAGQLAGISACLGALILICFSASAQNLPAPNGPPVVTTSPATFIASFSATLNGSLNSNGLTSTFHFQYGTTTNYGLTTPPQTQTGNTVRNVSADLSSLTASTTYHFRIVASNSNANGTRYGSDETFTTLTPTGRPVAITEAAVVHDRPMSVTLNGTVDPHGLTTTVYFQWGLEGWGCSSTYTTASQTKTGNTYQRVSSTVGVPGGSRIYSFRVVATNSGGTSYGNCMSFGSPCCE